MNDQDPILEVTIQHKSGGTWPVVAEYTPPGGLTVRREGRLKLGEKGLRRLGELELDPREYGKVLGQALFDDHKVRDLLTVARNDSRGNLRLLLVVEDLELRGRHWERLCGPVRLDGEWDLLALDQQVMLAHYVPSVSIRPFPAIGRADLKALVVVANPPEDSGWPIGRFDEAAVVAGLHAALSDIPHDVLGCVGDVVGAPTLDALLRQLTGETYTLLHVVAHGQYVPDLEAVQVYLLNDVGGVAPVTAKELRNAIDRVAGAAGLLPRLAFLATCESASPEAEAAGSLGGLGQCLVRDLGLPAVVAMTQCVSQSTAQALAAAFYVRLREHGDPHRALVQATAGLMKERDVTVPALFLRPPLRPLFGERGDRDLSSAEVRTGLEALEKVLPERAPVVQERFNKLRAGLQVSRAELSAEGQKEWDQALAGVSALCEQVTDLRFPALAQGAELPAYDKHCPFPGLRAFGTRSLGPGREEQDDRKYFFGREALVGQLVQCLKQHRFLAVLGSSGSGKSSLVLAGLVPTLQKQELDLQPAYLRPGRDPLTGLTAQRQQVKGRPALLVVDQFEELFTLVADEAVRRAFVEQLLQLLAATNEMRVVITMRADFWGDCAPYPRLRKEMVAHQVLVPPMTPQELRSAMEQQAAAVGLRFEADLGHRIHEDVQGEPGAMPLLQHALRELWQRRHGRWLLADEYRAIGEGEAGGIKGAIARTADALYEELQKESQDGERMLDLFARLTRFGEEPAGGERRRHTRRRVALDDLRLKDEDADAVRNLVNGLADARLVTTTSEGGPAAGEEDAAQTIWVEVAHEALLQHWPRLARWLSEEEASLRLRESIYQDAAEWEAGGKVDDLLPRWNPRIQAAAALFARPRFAPNDLEQAYIGACQALRDREREEERRRQEALQRQVRIARAGQLAAQSQVVLGERPQRSLLLAVEAVRLRPGEGEPHLPAAEQALRYAVGNTAGRPLSGHSSVVKAVAFSPDGRWLATGSDDDTARLWDLRAEDPAAEPRVLSGHGSQVWAVAFSPDGRWLATGSVDTTARLWDLQAEDPCAEPRVLTGHAYGVASVAFSPDGRWLATGSRDNSVWLWDLRAEDPAAEPQVLTGHEDQVWAVAFSPDGRWLATGSVDKTARLWDLRAEDPAAEPRVLSGHKDAVKSVGFSPDGRWLATGSWDNTARLWDLLAADVAKGPGTRRRRGRSPAATSLSESKCIRVLTGHTNRIDSVAFSVDGRWLATGSVDATARLWDVQTADLAAEPWVLRGHDEGVCSVAFSADGRWLATGGEDSTARLWDLRGADLSAEPRALRGHEEGVNAVAFSPDGRWLATGSDDTTARLWDLRAEDPSAQPRVLSGHEEAIYCVAWSPDGRWLATGSDDTTARLWDLQPSSRRAKPRVLRGHGGRVWSVAFSPDGRWLATGSVDKTAWLWDLRAEDPSAAPLVLSGHEDFVTSVAFSPDGRWLATGSYDTKVRLWGLQAEGPSAEPRVLTGHENWVISVAFSPDGRRLAAGSQDGTVRVWDLDAGPGVEPRVLRGHENWVYSVAFSPDGRRLAAGSDENVRLWDLAATDLSAQLLVLQGHQDYVSSVAFSADGRWLATGSDDTTARVWRMSLDELQAMACSVAGRNFSAGEWAQYFPDERYQKTFEGLPAGWGAGDDPAEQG